ncbi:MAG: hypothetical protein HN348_25020, partial [Proteobacteria bacterium]|nr:hypothetical protein [Pseudomonadota bacterium]
KAPETSATPEVDTPEIPTEATKVRWLTRRQYQWLKPRRHLLPQNPYGQTDFTAYSLEWGELKVGLSQIQVGVLPRTQIGTAPALDLLGVYNINAKVNAFRVGPVDMAILGQANYFPLGDFRSTFIGGGGMFSLRLMGPWTLHLGMQYSVFNASGIPSAPPAMIRAFVPMDEISYFSDLLAAGGTDPKIKANAGLLRLATDIRINRRDSIVLRANTIIFGKLDAELGFDEADEWVSMITSIVVPGASKTAISTSNRFKVSQAYTVTLSWQFSWQDFELRLGGGLSADKYSWILQSNEASYRIGGKTRRADAQRLKFWKKDSKSVQ